MKGLSFWRMTQGKVLEGVFAINKPTGISSAQVLRDLQSYFNPSAAFAPWIAAEKAKRQQESANQRKRRKQKPIQVKIGHGGTLDPLATGVLIAGIGRGTKDLQSFLECTKTYETVVLFGASTDTYDRVGRVLKRAPYQHITRDMVETALNRFRGNIMQLPPLYSALKMNGKPLYEYAREGKEIPREIEKRAVEVTKLELLDWMEGGSHDHRGPVEQAGKAEIAVAEKLWQQEKEADVQNGDVSMSTSPAKKRKLEDNQDEPDSGMPASKRRTSISEVESATSTEPLTSIAKREPPVKPAKPSKDLGPPAARIRMTVTSGFYVRSLCHDLGEAVGSQAMMAELIRTRQGQFELGENVLEYADLGKGESVWGPKVECMLDDWSAAHAQSGIVNVFRSGPERVEAMNKAEAEPPTMEKVEVAEDAAVTDEAALKHEAEVKHGAQVKDEDSSEIEIAVKEDPEKLTAEATTGAELLKASS